MDDKFQRICKKRVSPDCIIKGSILEFRTGINMCNKCGSVKNMAYYEKYKDKIKEKNKIKNKIAYHKNKQLKQQLLDELALKEKDQRQSIETKNSEN